MPYTLRRGAFRLIQPNFTVSVAVVITDEEGRVLLLDHVWRPGSGWGVPGGFINHQEQPEDAIRREIKEEVNLELLDLELVWIRTIGSHFEVLYQARAVGEMILEKKEIRSAEWFHQHQIPGSMPATQRAMVDKVFEWQAGANNGER